MIRHTIFYNNNLENTTDGVGVQDDDLNGEYEK